MATTLSEQKKKKEKEKPATRARALAPYREFPFFLSQLRDEFDRWLDRYAAEWPDFWGENGKSWGWGLDVREEDDAFIVDAEAPGFEVGDFVVNVTDNRLTLRATKKVEKKDENGKVQEYREQKCYESVRLPLGIATDKVEATYHNGILTVTLPKTAEGKGKRIAIKNA